MSLQSHSIKTACKTLFTTHIFSSIIVIALNGAQTNQRCKIVQCWCPRLVSFLDLFIFSVKRVYLSTEFLVCLIFNCVVGHVRRKGGNRPYSMEGGVLLFSTSAECDESDPVDSLSSRTTLSDECRLMWTDNCLLTHTSSHFSPRSSVCVRVSLRLPTYKAALWVGGWQ